MTEDEARLKICPVRTIFAPGEYPRGVGSNQQHPACMASGCMLWRWIDHRTPEDIINKKPPTQTDGYCGLGSAQ